MYRLRFSSFVRLGVFFAWTGVQPIAAAVPAESVFGEPLQLYLEVIINDVPTGLIAPFTETQAGELSIAIDQLEALGIVATDLESGPDGSVALAGIAGLDYSYDVAAQVVAITAATDRLQPQRLSAHRGQAGPADVSPALKGMVLNYSLFGAAATSQDHVLSGRIDARAFSANAVLDQSLLGRLDGDGPFAVRLDTTITRSDREALRTWRFGDFISGGLSWTRPLRLGGVQLQRNFGLRPDLVTMPLPNFSGSAAVPASVEVFANGARVFSDDVRPGPFTISELPVVSGAGTARIVTTDALGRTTESQVAFFASPALLRKGLSDFSVEAGFPRRSYGMSSDDYASTPVISGTLRHGLSDSLTGELHLEATPHHVVAGFGFASPIGTLGLAEAALAGSAGSGSGLQASLGVAFDFGRVHLRLRGMQTFGDYRDVATTTATDQGSSSGFRAVRQASLALPLAGGRSSIALGYADVESWTTHRRTASLTFSHRLPYDIRFHATGYTAVDGGDSGLFVGLSRGLGGGIQASSSVSSRDDAARMRVGLSRAADPRAGNLGWQLAGGIGEDSVDWLAAADLRTARARYHGTIRGDEDDLAASAEVNGAIIAAAGGFFLANRIDDAFAVVDVGAPGVTVYADNRPAGRTSRDGRLLVSGLRSWQANRLAIDIDELPSTGFTERSTVDAVPGDRSGVVVDFGLKTTNNAALLVIRDRNGSFLPPGSEGRRADGSSFLIGYDGEAYLENLGAVNRVEVVAADGSTCQGEFDHTPGESIQPVIEVMCQ